SPQACAMTQKISPAVFSSAARMASTMRALSRSESIASPASRGTTAPEGAPAAGEATTREASTARPGGARRPPRAWDGDENRSSCTSSRSGTGLPVIAALSGDAAYNHEENKQKERKRE